MEAILKAAAVGVVVCVLILVIKRHSKEQAMMLSLLTALSVTLVAFSYIRSVKPVLEQLQDATGLNGALLRPVYQCALIALISHFAAEVCKDAQEGTIGQGLMLLASMVSLSLCLPLLLSVLSVIRQLLGGAG